jgi:Uncharacterized conserved protein (DUF2190)
MNDFQQRRAERERRPQASVGTLTGVWELPQTTGQINEGAAVWSSTTDPNVKNPTGAGLYPIGVAVRGAGSSDTTGRVRLSGVPVVAVGA